MKNSELTLFSQATTIVTRSCSSDVQEHIEMLTLADYACLLLDIEDP